MRNVALMFARNTYNGGSLNGCLNDQDDLISLWQKNGITIEVDAYKEEKCKAETILSRLAYWASVLQPGDKFTFHYSGHGTYFIDRDGDEEDGYDEAIYPEDSKPVTDDVFSAALRKFAPGVDILVILDSCFSGDMTRALFTDPQGPKSKFFRMHDHIPGQMHKIRKKFLSEKSDINWTLISGCGERQTSADAFFGGRYNGACTYFLIKAYQKGQTKRQLYNALRGYLPSRLYDQIPQFEGNEVYFDTGVFGVPVSPVKPKKQCWLFKLFNK